MGVPSRRQAKKFVAEKAIRATFVFGDRNRHPAFKGAVARANFKMA
jgi:hypothetical protein